MSTSIPTVGRQMFDLDGKSAVVTGAGNGMGRAMALGLAEFGATVVVADIDGDAAERTATEITAKGGTSEAVKADITDQADVDRLMATADRVGGGLQILVNNAGILSWYDMEEMPMDGWDRVMDVNLRGQVLCMKAAIPGLKARGGSVINMGSGPGGRGAALNVPFCAPDYVAAKSGLQAVTRMMAQFGAEHGIRANAIAPGVVDTPMHAHQKDVIDGMVGYIPVGRLQVGEDLVGLSVFLASDASSYITGQTIHINGGILMDPGA